MQLVRGETTVADAADWARADRSTPDWQTDWQLVRLPRSQYAGGV
jgi:hypothetical protein